MNKPSNKRLGELQSDFKDCRVAGHSYKRWQPKIVRMVKAQASKARRQEDKRAAGSQQE